MRIGVYILFSFFFFLGNNALSQNIYKNYRAISLKIDEEQKRIDLYDGAEDEKIILSNKIAEEKANEAYFTLMDLMQEAIISSSQNDLQKFNDLVSLFNIMQRIQGNNFHFATYFHEIIENAYGILNSKLAGQLEMYIYKNTKASIQNVQLFKDEAIAPQILKDAAGKYPNEVLKTLLLISKEDYALELVEHICAVAPNNIKQYFSSSNVINRLVLESNDKIVNTVLQIFMYSTPNSPAYYFLDKIVENPSLSTINKYSQLIENKEAYYLELIDIRKKKEPLAEFNLEQELKVVSLEYIRPINDMHLMKDARERFTSVEKLSPELLYTMMVYTPEEIFTSTFNGVFDRMINKLDVEQRDRIDFLKSLGYNRFRTFIKLCSGYNTLNRFLEPLEPAAVDSLFQSFVLDLQLFDTDLSEAVDVADSFGSIEDKNLIALIAKHLHLQHLRMIEENNLRGEIIYGLLLSLINEKTDLSVLEGFDSARLFPLEGITHIPVDRLFHQKGQNIQHHYFYDDDDGIYSYASFIQAFSNGNWKISDSSEYVVIRSLKGMPVQIFANKPLSEREGQQRIRSYFENNEIFPDVVVHRGHSYYANISIEGVTPHTSLVFLGSCGSYHNLTGVADRSEIAHIISSKQIGTAVVNNSILRTLCDEIREGKDLVWEDVWKKLDDGFKSSKYDKDKFVDYIPPHKNMGALFIKTFREFTE